MTENLKVVLSKFRCLNNKLPIEIGTRTNVPREQRMCNLCEAGLIGDEFHYLFDCSQLLKFRKQYIKPYYIERPSTLKMNELMNLKNDDELLNLSLFVRIIMNML